MLYHSSVLGTTVVGYAEVLEESVDPQRIPISSDHRLYLINRLRTFPTRKFNNP